MKYETAQDVAKEKFVAEQFSKFLQKPLKKNMEFYPFDYCVMDQANKEVLAFLEVRTVEATENAIKGNGGFYYPANKLNTLKSYLESTMLPIFIVVQTGDDKIFYRIYKQYEKPIKMNWFGRVRQDGTKNYEACGVLDWHKFKKISTT